MRNNIFLLSIFILLISPIFIEAQTEVKFNIGISLSGLSEHSKVYETQFKSYLNNELMKIPDVKISNSNSDYILMVSIFENPCDCHNFEFYYRANFFNNKKKLKALEIVDPFVEGFESYKQIEEWSKNIISDLNINVLSRIR